MVKRLTGGRLRVGRFSAALCASAVVLGIVSSSALAQGSSSSSFSMPSFTATQPPDTGAVSTVMGWMQWGGLAVCVLGLIFAGAKMGISHRQGGGGSDHISSVGYVIGGAILIGAASSVIGALA
jgi:hypothetical protein